MVYPLRWGMNKNPLKTFAGVDEFRFKYSLVLHDVSEIQADDEIKTSNRCGGNVNGIC